MLRSELYEIKGISGKSVEKLLSHFHSIEKVKTATVDELNAIIGKSKSVIIRSYFDSKNADSAATAS